MLPKMSNVTFTGAKLPNYEKTQRKLYGAERYIGVPNFDNSRSFNRAGKKSYLNVVKGIFRALCRKYFK